MLTKDTAACAAIAKMSAHETVPLQVASTFDLMVSITSKPLIEFALGNAFFSPVKFDVSSNRTDASQP